MKKIMFNDKYGLTDAVLKGRKTMTRRIIRNLSDFDPRQDWMHWSDNGKANIAIMHIETYKYCIYPQYQPGEVVAVAQRYSELAWDAHLYEEMKSLCKGGMPQYHLKGWDNKMFVRADLMPHQIRIIDIKVERLQDISEEDCLKEGVLRREIIPFRTIEIKYQVPKTVIYKDNPIDAFAALIDKVSGKGTWVLNPFVFVYSFELVK